MIIGCLRVLSCFEGMVYMGVCFLFFWVFGFMMNCVIMVEF